MAMFNLIRLTTFSVGTVARMVFTVNCVVVIRRILANSNYYTLSHYAPEFEESKSKWLEHVQTEHLHGGANPLEHEHDYYMPTGGKGTFSRLLNLRVFAGFIAAIELLRVRVRAVSLSLRLIANLSCGHILLTLYSSNLVSGFEIVGSDQLQFLGTVMPLVVASVTVFSFRPNGNRHFHIKKDNGSKPNRDNNGRRNPSRRRIALVIAFIILRCYKWYIREEVTRTITLLIGVITLFSKQIFGEYEAYYFIFVYTLFLSEQMKHTLIWFRYWWYWDVPYLDWCWTNDVWDYHLCLEYDHWFTEGMPLPYDIEFYDLDYNNECREVI